MFIFNNYLDSCPISPSAGHSRLFTPSLPVLWFLTLSLPTWIITSPSPSLVPVEAVWPNVKLFLVLTHYENLPDWGFLSELPLLKFALRQTLCHFILIFFQNRENSKSLILILKWVLVSSSPYSGSIENWGLLRGHFFQQYPPTRGLLKKVLSWSTIVTLTRSYYQK